MYGRIPASVWVIPRCFGFFTETYLFFFVCQGFFSEVGIILPILIGHFTSSFEVFFNINFFTLSIPVQLKALLFENSNAGVNNLGIVQGPPVILYFT
jgi:hypothetical protein